MKTKEKNELQYLVSSRFGIKYKIKTFIFSYCIIAICVFLFTFWAKKNRVNNERASLFNESFHLKNLVSEYIKNEFKNVFFDLEYLSEQYEYFLKNEFNQKEKFLNYSFKYFFDSKKYIYNLRILDVQGNEIFKICRENTNTIICEKSQLQNKSAKVYFQKTLELLPGQIYISNFNLNKEFGKIEIPIKPVIRFSKLLFKNNKKFGMIVLNFDGNYLLNNIHKIRKNSEMNEKFNSENNLILISDKNGSWLIGETEKEAWGTDIAERKEFNIKNKFKIYYDEIQKYSSGKFISLEGLVSFFNFIPIKNENNKYVSDLKKWKIFSFFRTKYFDRYLKNKNEFYNNMTGIFLTLNLIFVYFYVKMRALKKIGDLKLQYAAQRDQLTLLLNRHSFLDILDYEISKFGRYENFLSLIMCDIDYFKKINDTYGHNAGDYILKSVSTVFKKHLRKQDSICRWGGEEFLILLPSTKGNDAYNIAEKLRKIIKETNFKFSQDEIKVTMSFGVCSYKPKMKKLKFIDTADLLLYNSKQNGRNLVSFEN